MVPFTGRTHLVVVSRSKVREYEEYCFAMFKEMHESKILGNNHPDTVRVPDIAHKIISATSSALAVEQSGQVDLVDGLNWEVIVVRDLPGYAKCYPGAGKIIATTRLLDSFETDAEIAVSIAHEVGHVVARHSSEIAYHTMCFPKIALLPFFRRNEAEADHIGMLLHVAAGYDPHVVLEVRRKYIKIAEGSSRMRKLLYAHPSAKKRLRLLSEPKVMEEALNLYRQVNDIRDGVGLSM